MLSYPSSSRSESLQCLWQTKVCCQSIVSAQALCSRAKTAVFWQHFLCQTSWVLTSLCPCMQTESSCSIWGVAQRGRAEQRTAPAQNLKSSEKHDWIDCWRLQQEKPGMTISWGQKLDGKTFIWHKVFNLNLGSKKPFSPTHLGPSNSQGNGWVPCSQVLIRFWQARFIQSPPDFLSGPW